jgi:leucyl-tRNA---protein transferase
MSENNIYYPEKLNGKELDEFLETGWYRMGQSVFTTHFLTLKDYTYRVFWLRYNLKNITLSKSQQRIKAGNKQFNVSIKPLQITVEIEDLYAAYKTGITFQAAPTVHYWLYGDQPTYNVFETELIEIRDKNKLIAVGIADLGSESIAGIMNFYHPDYKRFSLGKYLMLLKIEQAQRKNLCRYYPGYIVYQRPEFDYKLDFDKNSVEVFIPELGGWQLYRRQLTEKYGVVIQTEL